MKREDVKNKIPGITEEQLNWLMQENGSDITREKISIHTLLAESDLSLPETPTRVVLFLSTLSLRRATFLFADHIELRAISIHALLAESDQPATKQAQNLLNFYPRSPCGERRTKTAPALRGLYFYPRSPCGERRRRIIPN